MKIVGCDLHTRYQQIAMLDQETGELVERRLEHASGEARAFYGARWPHGCDRSYSNYIEQFRKPAKVATRGKRRSAESAAMSEFATEMS